LSNAYTDFMYTYEQRPNCSRSQPSCNSQFLFCDFLNGPEHCVSKIKLGRPCGQFAGEDACYMGICSGGYCMPNSVTSASSTSIALSTRRITSLHTTQPPPTPHQIASIDTFHVPICSCKVNALKGVSGWRKIAKLAVAGAIYQRMICVSGQL
ncbi:unnamed protein product, partial [Litomosoides sigmodontis]